MLIDAVRNDPDWNDGNCTMQPRALKTASAFYGIANLSMAGQVPT